MQSGTQETPPSARRLGKYELQQQVGRGNVGEVWKGYDFQAKQEVAIKLIHSDLQSDPRFLLRFTTEGEKLTALRHENIVPVREVAVAQPQDTSTIAYIASDFIEGPSLTTYINMTSRRGMFPSLADIVYLFTSLGVAIDYAHQQGVVHGDLKPNNILLNAGNTLHFASGEPLLTDFGLPSLLGEEVAICSPLYMSPEQAKGEEPSNRSDIYSLGVILYELCTGVQPFRDSSSVAVLMEHIKTLPTPPLLINPQLPPQLSEVILRALAKDPSTRFSMASLFATAIADACSIYPNIALPRHILAEEEAPYSISTGSYSSILGVPQPINVSPPASSPSSPSHARIAAHEASPSYVTRPSQPAIALPSSQAERPLSTTSKHTLPIPAVPATPEPSLHALPTSPMPSSPVSPQPQVSPLSPTQTAMPSLLARKWSRRSDMTIYAVVGLLLLLVIIGGSIVSNLLLWQQSVVGHIFFQDDAFGYADQLRIEMPSINAPGADQEYRGWLQTDRHQTLSLGTLTQTGSGATLIYHGDSHHTNLLSIAQGVLVTQENRDSTNTNPQGSVIYHASFDSHALPYIRNILYKTPNFPSQTGVVVGLFTTLKSMDDKAGSLVDSIQGTHDLALAKRQAIRILELIDGTQYAMASGDLPHTVPSYVNAAVGIISSPTQPGYLDTLSTQLNKLQVNVSNNGSQMQHIQNMRNAISDIRSWIQQARTYDVAVVKGQNLASPTLVDAALHVQQLIADAYTGRTIPPDAGPSPALGSAGAYQAYAEGQYLASLDISHA